jgi:hypothetical protein
VPLSRRRWPPLLLAWTFACTAGFAAPRAAADDALCVASSEQALSLRKSGKLREALKELAVCADATCPAEVRTECAHRIDEVKGALPTLILAAKDGASNDLYAVRVSVDGVPIASTLDGLPIVLDPGEHTFTFEAAGQPPVDKRLVLREGEKDRREVVLIGPPAPPPLIEAPAPSTHPVSTWTSRKTWAVVSAGVGLTSIALGAVWGAFAISSQSRESSDCSKKGCPNPAQAQEDYSKATQNATASTVLFVVGGALVATGAVLWLTAPRPTDASPGGSGSLRLAPTIGTNAGGLVLLGGF